MEALLPHVVGPAVGGVIALVLIWVTIPRLADRHKEQVSELIGCFRSAVDKIGTHVQRVEDKLDALASCQRPTLQMYDPDPEPPKAA